MNNYSLNGQFLEGLTNEQKGMLWDYYQLLHTPSISIDDEVKQVGQIWERAENDPVLCKWLELIDYFYTDVSEVDEKLDNDKRSYYSEHFEVILEQMLNPRNQQDCIPEGREFHVLFCPDHSGFIRVPVEDKNLSASIDSDQQVCQRCKAPFDEHKIAPSGRVKLL